MLISNHPSLSSRSCLSTLSNPFYIFCMCIYNSIYIILGVLIRTNVIIMYVSFCNVVFQLSTYLKSIQRGRETWHVSKWWHVQENIMPKITTQKKYTYEDFHIMTPSWHSFGFNTTPLEKTHSLFRKNKNKNKNLPNVSFTYEAK